MGKKYKRLYSQITDTGNIREAYRKASKGKRRSVGYLNFKEYEEANISMIKSELEDQTYTSGGHRIFEIRDPKKRTISALPFRDRVVQHALCAIISPIFESTMLPNSHACREGSGTHSGAKYCQSRIRRIKNKFGSAHILKTDFSGYFYNIDRSILWKLIKAKISCRKTLSLISKFLPSTGKGIPIGNLTSQLFANVYGTAVDRFLSQTLKVKNYARYMDDIVIIHHSRRYLESVCDFLEWFCHSKMDLFFSKSYIKNSDQGIDFLGYRIFPNYKLVRKDSVTRARRKIKRYTMARDAESLSRFISAFSGHVKHADSKNLMVSLAKYYERINHVCKV